MFAVASIRSGSFFLLLSVLARMKEGKFIRTPISGILRSGPLSVIRLRHFFSSRSNAEDCSSHYSVKQCWCCRVCVVDSWLMTFLCWAASPTQKKVLFETRIFLTFFYFFLSSVETSQSLSLLCH